MGKSVISSILLLSLTSIYGTSFAATQINLRTQNKPALSGQIQIKETSRQVDMNGTVHIRIKQLYKRYPVWGADGVVHIPKNIKVHDLTLLLDDKSGQIKMNGTIYEGIDSDLNKASNVIFSQAQREKALQHAIKDFMMTTGRADVKEQEANLIVYVDDNVKAHWAFRVSFYADPLKDGDLPSKPNYILDAETFEIYQKWDNLQTNHHAAKPMAYLDIEPMPIDKVAGGGYGGNEKMGKIAFDGLSNLTNHFGKLKLSRDAGIKTCYLQNEEVTVKHNSTKTVVTFDCDKLDSEHNNVYWDDALHAVNGGFSPDNDALFNGNVIKDLYQTWYGVPVLTENGKPMMLNMIVHARMDNAYWDGKQMTFGDGINLFYPLTSLGVAAHEVSHGFTQQHSDLLYYGQSGGMNESFSDMAAQAAEFFAFGKCSWQIGPEIFKAPNEALRYMDKPSKDCKGKTPGSWCSIDSMDQYHSGLDVHFSSGIYNRVFYLMGTAQGWDAKKAFNVMVNANMHYWTSRSSFAEGACGVLSAANDLKYDVAPIKTAFQTVGVDISACDK